MKHLSWFLLAIAGALPASAQTILPKPPITRPSVIAPPASLTAQAGPSSILVTFPAVTGASGYRVTRTDNAGEPETVIYNGAAASFAFQGAACAAPQGCAYTDAAVTRGFLYSYRVYSLFGSVGAPTVSGPSPVASAKLKFATVRP